MDLLRLYPPAYFTLPFLIFRILWPCAVRKKSHVLGLASHEDGYGNESQSQHQQTHAHSYRAPTQHRYRPLGSRRYGAAADALSQDRHSHCPASLPDEPLGNHRLVGGIDDSLESHTADYQGNGELPQMVDVPPCEDGDAGHQEADEEYPSCAKLVYGRPYHQR